MNAMLRTASTASSTHQKQQLSLLHALRRRNRVVLLGLLSSAVHSSTIARRRMPVFEIHGVLWRV